MAKTQQTVARTGNEAVAEAMRQINPDVVAAYPITPQTEIMQIFSDFVSNGKVITEFIPVESEHSAMSATLGAAAAGARSMTATSSQGLMLMAEILPITAGLRLPIVMGEVNRAISAPINIHCDHSDTMFCRDAGWIQIFSENTQEAYDNMLQAIKISEHMDVRLPSMVTTDGFIISHAMENLDILSDEEVQNYIGQYQAVNHLLDFQNVVTLGSIDLQNYYFEHRTPIADALQKAKDVIVQVGQDFGKNYGRSYGLFEEYYMEDAETAILCLGSTAGTAKVVVDDLRSQGKKVGLIKLRVYRPFPFEALIKSLAKVKAIAVLDRSDALSTIGGPVFNDLCSSLYSEKLNLPIINYIYGLGGRDIDLHMIKDVYQRLENIKNTGETGKVVSFLGARI